MPISPHEYLQHILDEIEYLASQKQGLSEKQFLENPTLQRAFVRSIEIIGEASKNVAGDLKNRYQQVEWKAMAGMRDRLIHGYMGVDYHIVWDVVQNKIPILHEQINKIIHQDK